MTHIALLLEICLNQTNSFIRFLLVGVLNTLVGLSTIFLLMDALAVNYWLSTFIGNGAGAVISFLLNRTFTFKSGVSLKKGGVLFVAVITLCYTVSYGTSEWLSGHLYHLFPVSQQNLAVILGTCIYTVTNYIGQKLIVFKQATG
ncbi:GtrA family protein [Peribacillus cavernae]|uniref:GtrA family protein n=1 Tax=Peribacillus cavernae TaxID=1674310 RepID=A0A3S0TZM2_9BACI|nr:GtrA family protein [Peribacillus cavernae]MDQ0218874.1 putative flippase GtrA [Peribacillus cavernae]RUQ31073.1 GtrA family protein [Peribacillus cavernae]